MVARWLAGAHQCLPAAGGPRPTCEGEDISPEITWAGAPAEAAAFALILHDPDAPRTNGFTHWMVYNIPRNVTHIPENVPERPRVSGLGLQGKNDGGKIGYMGPCPPSGTHRYYLRLFALRKELELGPGATAPEVQSAMDDHIIEQAELMGTYAKTRAKSAKRRQGQTTVFPVWRVFAHQLNHS